MMLFVRLAATTGARRGEILGLVWSDIDFVQRRVSLVHGIVDGAGGPVRQERKTKNANCVDLDDDTMVLLREHFELCTASAGERGLVVDRLPLFGKPSDMTQPWAPNWVTKRFAVALDHAGVAHFRLHDLRHFVATQMLAAGVSLPVVSTTRASPSGEGVIAARSICSVGVTVAAPAEPQKTSTSTSTAVN